MNRVDNPCVECRFSKSAYGYDCTRPELQKPHMVLGSTEPECFKMREEYGACGPEGRYFAPRSPKRSKLSLLQRLKEAFTSDGF